MTHASEVNGRKAALLAALPSIRHGFFTREGGVSAGLVAGLNCGFGADDDPANVTENRRRVADALGIDAGRLQTVYQVHGDAVAVARHDCLWARETAPRADAMVTDQPGIGLGILSADCAPVLFADAEARVIGAAHAGWKGAKIGVLAATVAAMERLGARRQRIVAAIGPTINQASYEVGPEFRAGLVQDDPANDRFFQPGRADRSQFDLPGYVAARLADAGVGTVDRLTDDTAADPARFFSYRRACLAGEQEYGRLLAAITLAA